MEVTEGGDYFESYEDLNVHQLMLEDGARNASYQQAIFDNINQIKGRTVLDVGCGTGILSVFCAQAGAAKIYAIEASNTYKIAEEIVKENGFETIIEVINSRIEDCVLPEKVDIIVSEWMGFYLLHEAMLDSIIVARDKFLKPGGMMFPESATLYASPCSVPSMFDNWQNVSGVSMRSFSKLLRNEASRKPITTLVSPDHILAEPEVVTWLNLREITLEDLSSIELEHVAVASRSGKYQGICLWFTCTFPSYDTEPVTLSTAPDEPPTHWKQTTIVFPTEYEVETGAPMAFKLNLNRSMDSSRRYNLEVTMLDAEEVQHAEYCTCYLTKCILTRAMLEKYEKDDLGK